MLRTTTACFASVLILSLTTTALAEGETGDYSREGPYLGLDGLLAIENSTDRLDVDNTGGLAGRIGYRLTPEFAMELEGEWAYLDGRNPWSLSTVLKFYPFEFLEANPLEAALEGRLQPFVVSSAGIIVGDLGRGQNPGGSFRAGVGTDFWLNNDLAVSWQVVYVANAGDGADYDTVNTRLGVTWRY